MEKKIIDGPLREKLRAPFPDEAYSKHPTKTFLTTLKAMYVTERLNNVFGIGRWTVEHEVIERTENYVLVLGKLVLLDYDCHIPAQYGGHGTTGKNTEIADGYKSAITDLLSKSASYLEIGIDMFKGLIPPKGGAPKKEENTKPWLNETTKDGKVTEQWTKVCDYIVKGGKIEGVEKKYIINKVNKQKLENL